MKVQRPTTEPKNPPKPAPPQDEEDVEGHFMTVPTYLATELARSRERDVKKASARHPLVAEARERARAKR